MADWEKIDAYLVGRGIRIDAPNPGQTTGGLHVPGSEHYQGRARDYGLYDSDAFGVCRAMVPFAQGPNYIVDELFFTPLSIFYKNGQATRLNAAEMLIHKNHCHVGIRAGANFPITPISRPVAVTPGPVFQEDKLQSLNVHVPALDAQGHGYIDLGIPAETVVSVICNGQDPEGRSYGAFPRFTRSAHGPSGTRIEIADGPAGGAIDFTVWQAGK